MAGATGPRTRARTFGPIGAATVATLLVGCGPTVTSTPTSPPSEAPPAAGAVTSAAIEHTPMPWGDSETVPAARVPAFESALAELRPEDTWPFPPSVATEIGVVQGCLHWPDAEFHAPITTPLRGVPILVLTGVLDLSTPVENADAAVATLPDATFVTVPDAGHAAQLRPSGAAVVSEFLVALDAR